MFPWNLLPFNKNMKDAMKNMKPEEIDHFVQDLMKKIMPSNMMGSLNPQELFDNFQIPNQYQNSGPLQAAAFETHDYVYVRIPIKSNEWIKQLRIYHTTNQLIVEHIPNPEDKNIITLPAIVKKKGAAAHYKDGILEVKIPKNIDMQYSQIDVTEFN